MVNFHFVSLEEEVARDNFANALSIFQKLSRLKAKLSKSSSGTEEKLRKLFQNVDLNQEERVVRAFESFSLSLKSTELDMVFEKERSQLEHLLVQTEHAEPRFVGRRQVAMVRLKALYLLGEGEKLLREFNSKKMFINMGELSEKLKEKLTELGGEDVKQCFLDSQSSCLQDSIEEELV